MNSHHIPINSINSTRTITIDNYDKNNSYGGKLCVLHPLVLKKQRLVLLI